MPKQKFALERRGPKRLEVSWGAWFRNFTVKFDGNQVGERAKKSEIVSGINYVLPDNSTLNVLLEKNRLNLVRNGRPIPNSFSDPVTKLNTAVSIIFVVAVLTALGGFVLPALQSTSSTYSGARISGTTSAIIIGVYIGLACLFAFLGFLVRQRIRIALWITLALYAIDTLLTIYSVLRGNSTFVTTVLIHVVCLYYMYQGFKGLDALDYEERRTSVNGESLPTLPNAGPKR